MKDPYKILNISYDASLDEVKKTYRKLAIQWHPDKNINNKEEAEEKFKIINEAYNIICRDKMWQQHKMYAEDDDFIAEEIDLDDYGYYDEMNDDYSYGSFVVDDEIDNEDSFLSFSGLNNDSSNDSNFFKFKNKAYYNENGDTLIDLEICLEDFYYGTSIPYNIKRKIINKRGLISFETEDVIIDVLPGTKNNTKVYFEKKGDSKYGFYTKDVIFIIKQKEHDTYIRKGNNIIYDTTITRLELLQGTIIEIDTISGDSVNVEIEKREKINPRMKRIKKVVKGHGMPLLNNPSQFGDMIVNFNITD